MEGRFERHMFLVEDLGGARKPRLRGNPGYLSMVRLGTITDRAELPCHDLRLPFGIEAYG